MDPEPSLDSELILDPELGMDPEPSLDPEVGESAAAASAPPSPNTALPLGRVAFSRRHLGPVCMHLWDVCSLKTSWYGRSPTGCLQCLQMCSRLLGFQTTVSESRPMKQKQALVVTGGQPRSK
jgi:hypothetical protein